MTAKSPLMVSMSNQARLASLFLRSRRSGWASLYLIGIAVFVASLVFVMRETNAEGRDPFTNAFDGSPIPFVLVFVPLALALVLGVAIHGPFGEMERTVSRPLPPLRLGQVAGLLLCSVVTLLLLAQAWEGDVGRVFLRNLAGLAGLALLAAPFVGGRLSWLLPFSYGIIAFWIGASSEPPRWAWPLWPLQPPADGLALTVALALVGAGLAVAAVFGARYTPGEAA